MTCGLTERQLALLRFIATSLEARGIAPSYEEMTAHLGLSGKSKSSVHRMLTALEDREWIKRKRRCARAISVLQPPPRNAGNAARMLRAAPMLLEACQAQRRLLRAAELYVPSDLRDQFERAGLQAEEAVRMAGAA